MCCKWLRWLLPIVGCGLLVLIMQGCGGRTRDPWEGKPEFPRVVTSFAPIYCFTRNVAGDHAGLICVCLDKGPHEYEINATQDILPLQKADLFLVNGLQLDSFTEELFNKAGNKKLKMVNLADEAVPADQLIKLPGDGKGNDAHVWTGIPEAIAIVKVIRNHLKEIDPKHAEDYDKNANVYCAKLQALLEEGKLALKPRGDGKGKLRVIPNHDSLAYFARAFDLEIVGFLEDAPGHDPDAKQIDNLTRACEKKPAQVIAVEPQYDPRPADALLAHMQGRVNPLPVVVEIDPLETATATDLEDRDWYEKKIRENINRLKKYVP
jgi:zinc transport system substrate-binding protein